MGCNLLVEQEDSYEAARELIVTFGIVVVTYQCQVPWRFNNMFAV